MNYVPLELIINRLCGEKYTWEELIFCYLEINKKHQQ